MTSVQPTSNAKPSSQVETATYLQSLKAVRERCTEVFALGQEGKLEYFVIHEDKEKEVVEYCKRIIERDFGTQYDTIPPHGRRNHFITSSPSVDRIAELLAAPGFPKTPHEITKSLLDLYVVSVLLDAGAGNVWSYTEAETGWKGGRSEGLAVASYRMFCEGLFSSDKDKPYQVDAKGLCSLTVEAMTRGLQIAPENPMNGLEGRISLLKSLGEAIKSQPDIFAASDDGKAGSPPGRPGNLLDYFSKMFPAGGDGIHCVPIHCFWGVLLSAFSSIWPARLTLGEVALGDVWHCEALSKARDATGKRRTEGDDLVPFHKLSQWLCYSLIQPIEEHAGWKITGWQELMTGLAEYRNGGLLVDLGYLELRPLKGDEAPQAGKLPRFSPDHPAIVEWRALTVISLDRIAVGVRESLGITDPHKLTLAQVLEAATWKGGREIAKAKRGSEGGGRESAPHKCKGEEG